MKFLALLFVAVGLLSANSGAQLVVKTGNDGVIYTPLPIGIPSPVISGTITGTYALGGTPTVAGTPLTPSSILSPIFSGTSTGLLVVSGTFSGGTYLNPVFAGSATGSLNVASVTITMPTGQALTSAVLAGAGTKVTTSGTTGGIILTDTPAVPVAGQIVRSGTTMLLYTSGTTYTILTGETGP